MTTTELDYMYGKRNIRTVVDDAVLAVERCMYRYSTRFDSFLVFYSLALVDLHDVDRSPFNHSLCCRRVADSQRCAADRRRSGSQRCGHSISVTTVFTYAINQVISCFRSAAATDQPNS